MKNVIIVILVLVIIAGIAFIALNFNKIAEHEEPLENTENITEEITFVRTYNIVSDLQRTDRRFRSIVPRFSGSVFNAQHRYFCGHQSKPAVHRKDLR